MNYQLIDFLVSPITHEKLVQKGTGFIDLSGNQFFPINDQGIPLFAKEFCSEAAKQQQKHYDKVAAIYTENLSYPHTKEYMSYLDTSFLDSIADKSLGVTAEICCGTAEGFKLARNQIDFGIGVDISTQMLVQAQSHLSSKKFHFIQGDATQLPLKSCSFDTVVMLGGIHHVPNREALFNEIGRILKPNGLFIWREPVSDFWLWKTIRKLIYRISPNLDHETESPLEYRDTVPILQNNQFNLLNWETYGFFGFCLFMNSDVLFFNRLFRFIPGIEKITRLSAKLDDYITHTKAFKRSGLQVIGMAQKC